ncbi:MAG: hybrid sensor histidine kinase/response regulator, partial [Pseudomonadota bacterium]|nr:hybrid sensor histidine kinase/response regulator [Pseudomonadota bacterium]
DMLIDLGFSVIEATSVDEASALTADIPDIALVLSDIRLEGEATGIDLADRLAGSQLPCILMTSLPPGDALHRAALQRGPVLQKPFTTQQLSALIKPEKST